MKMRRYLAKDMRQALNQVREAQGPDAIILSSRRTDEGVEVVAAIDFDAETALHSSTETGEQQYASTAPDFTAQMQRIPIATEAASDMSTELHGLRRLLETQVATLAWNDLTRRAPLQTALLKELTQLGFAQALVIEVVSQVPARLDWHAAQRMALALIAKRIVTDNERWLEQGGMVAFVGPTGVGKSTLVAKLAARWVLRHGPRELVLIAADSVRIGAQDQLLNLGRLLGVPTYTVDHMVELKPILSSLTGNRLVLIDTAGFSQRDARLAAELELLTTAHSRLETSLVVSANTQAGTLDEIFLRFAAATPKSCVLTKVDEATSLGGSISALTRYALPVTYFSEGQRIPEDLSAVRAHQLVVRAVELARRSGAQADEELLTLRFGGVAHALA
jgi:flagellar biosynthesis protein FlhF